MSRIYLNENGVCIVESERTISKRVVAKKKKAVKKVMAFSLTLAISIASIGVLTKVVAEAGSKSTDKKIASYQKVELVVGYGDTVWDLQKDLTPNADVRELIYLAEKYNNKELSNIHPGESIVLFKDK